MVSLNEHFVEVRLYKFRWFMKEDNSYSGNGVFVKFEVVDEGTQQGTVINKL